MTTTFNPPSSLTEDPGRDTGDDFGINVGDAVAERLDYRYETIESRRLPRNVGRAEQRVRLGMGVALLSAAAFAPLSRGWRIGLAAFAVAELVTGSLRYCPVSQALGINTNEDGET